MYLHVGVHVYLYIMKVHLQFLAVGELNAFCCRTIPMYCLPCKQQLVLVHMYVCTWLSFLKKNCVNVQSLYMHVVCTSVLKRDTCS